MVMLYGSVLLRLLSSRGGVEEGWRPRLLPMKSWVALERGFFRGSLPDCLVEFEGPLLGLAYLRSVGGFLEER